MNSSFYTYKCYGAILTSAIRDNSIATLDVGMELLL